MLKDASVLILDEATLLVDTRIKLIIQNVMNKLIVNKTSFVILHWFSIIKNIHIILVMTVIDKIEKNL